MKRSFTLKLMLALLLVAALMLTGCGSKSGGSADPGKGSDASVDSLKTFGDIIELEAEDKQQAVYENKVVFAFRIGDTYYRAIGEISDEMQQEYFDIDMMQDGYEEKQNEMLAPVKIDKIENLDDYKLSQEELDKLVGKTGQELQDEGWTFSGHDLDNMEFWMNYGPFTYTVVFDGKVDEKDYESFEDEAGTKDMKVKTAEFQSIGDATDLANE